MTWYWILWLRHGIDGGGSFVPAWVGIDLSLLAVKLVNERIASDRAATKEAEHNPVIGGSLFQATALTVPPVCTDLGDLPNYRMHRHRLYGEQGGVCAGCDTHFPFRVMDVDHILPRSKGGTDHPENLQLLRFCCNRSKGRYGMTQEEQDRIYGRVVREERGAPTVRMPQGQGR